MSKKKNSQSNHTNLLVENEINKLDIQQYKIIGDLQDLGLIGEIFELESKYKQILGKLIINRQEYSLFIKDMLYYKVIIAV